MRKHNDHKNMIDGIKSGEESDSSSDSGNDREEWVFFYFLLFGLFSFLYVDNIV